MKRMTTIAAAALLGLTSSALAQYPPSSTAPAGYPPSAQPDPTLVPATPSAAPAGPATLQSQPKVQVFPFDPIGNVGDLSWAAKGIQASLQSDVSHTGAMLLMAPGAPAPGFDLAAIAKSNGATLAITGTYQVENGSVRADGHLVDVNTGQPVGGFSGKAPVGSVFQLEDALGEQLKRLLPVDRVGNGGSSAPGAVTANGTFADQPQQVTGVQPTPVVEAPAVTYSSEVPTTYAPAVQETYVFPSNSYYGTGYGYPYGGYYDGYYGGYSPFGFGFYGGVGYYSGYGYGRGYYGGRGNYNRGYGGGYGLRSNPTFHNPVYGGSRGGFTAGTGGGRAYGLSGRSVGGGGGGMHAAAAGGGGFAGGGHGGGGGGHR